MVVSTSMFIVAIIIIVAIVMIAFTEGRLYEIQKSIDRTKAEIAVIEKQIEDMNCNCIDCGGNELVHTDHCKYMNDTFPHSMDDVI